MTAPTRRLRIAGATLELGGRPLLMGIVNATPDSFSDGELERTLDARTERAAAQLAAGAAMIDIGGESGVTNRPPVSEQEEIERVVPLIARVSRELGAIVSVDTYKPEVARAAIAAGASLVNDVSGLLYPELADVCADTGAGLVVMHTRATPKQKRVDSSLDGRVMGDVEAFLGERITLAIERGVAFEQLMLDPGPDFSKTPAQTVEVLRAIASLHALQRPLLLAVSRKDFIGAVTGRPPGERLAGTLAAVAHGVRAGAHVVRVHDVAEVADFLAISDVLDGQTDVDVTLRIPEQLRREQGLDPVTRAQGGGGGSR